MVTPSRKMQPEPIVSVESSPWYFRSCGSWPIEANGKIRVRAPTLVTACNRDVTQEFDAFAEFNLRAYNAEWPDLDPWAELGALMNDGRSMDCRFTHAGLQMRAHRRYRQS